MLGEKIALCCANASLKMLEFSVELEKKGLENKRKKVTKLCESMRKQKIQIMKDEEKVAEYKLRVSYVKADIVSEDGKILGKTKALVMA